MLNENVKGEWRTKVKSIFTEAQKKFEEQEDAEGGLDLGNEPAEDPAVDAAPVDGAVDPTAGAGEVEEEEPTITVTASLLKALLDYCSAPSEEEEVVDPVVDPTAAPVEEPVAEVAGGVNPSMTAPVMTTNTGVMENAVPGEEPVVDDALDAVGGGEEVVDAEVEGDEEVSPDEIVQRLVDLSAESGGEPLDVDVLAVVFSPEPEGEDLGDGELDNNVELPATTGDQTVPASAPAPVAPPANPVA